MKAAWYERKGPAREVLQVGEMPDPQPGPGEVRVRVAVSGVNPSDTKGRGNWGGNDAMDHPRVVPGQDGAGVIDQVGPGVHEARVGERVWVYEAQWQRPFGTAAAFVVVPGEQATRLPDRVSFSTGASLGVPAMTAHRCLFRDGALHGQTVLVSGGGGAVGQAAVHLAAWAGAQVVATVSRPEQADAAHAAGAHLVLHRTDDVVARVREATQGEGVDRIVEVAFEANLEQNLKLLRTNGVIATYSSGDADSAPRIPFYPAIFQCLTVQFVLVYGMPAEAHREAVRDITACLASGRYRPAIGQRFPLPEVAVAHEAQDSGKVVGKVLIDVGGEEMAA